MFCRLQLSASRSLRIVFVEIFNCPIGLLPQTRNHNLLKSFVFKADNLLLEQANISKFLFCEGSRFVILLLEQSKSFKDLLCERFKFVIKFLLQLRYSISLLSLRLLILFPLQESIKI